MAPPLKIQESVSIRDRLSFRLLRNVAISVLAVEIVLASGQILFDYRIHNEYLDETAIQILKTVEKAASYAIWTLDIEGGQNLLSGLLRHNAIIKAELIDSKEQIFSSAQKSTTPSALYIRWLFGGYRLYTQDLNIQYGHRSSESVGQLKLTYDTGATATSFFKRTLVFLVTGLLINLALAIILLYVFHATMVRSILSIGDFLAKVNPQNPGSYRVKLPPQHEKDELGSLINKTNDLLKAVGENIQRRQEIEEEMRVLNIELEERVAARTKELELTNQELESFTYAVSHDLQGGLRAISGLSNAVLEDYIEKLDQEGVNYLQGLVKSSNQIEALTRDLLRLSRSTRGGISPSMVNLSAIASDVMKRLKEAEPERDVTVKIAPDIRALADPRLIWVVMENLLGNAWKFSSKSPNVYIKFGTEKGENGPLFFVRDNGSGFDMSHADKLFVPFKRFHRNDDFTGTGIGLTTVKRIILRHGGQIWAESVVGQGATFYFTLETRHPD
ncbi:hypothetical protein KJ966_08310 [bacterium]|nr:hypothetical protein [bacterium]